MMKLHLILSVMLAAFSSSAAEIAAGGFSFGNAPAEIVVTNTPSTTYVFTLVENCTTGYEWFFIPAVTNGFTAKLEHLPPPEPRPGEPMLCGAPGRACFKLTPEALTNETVVGELQYKRCWEKDVPPAAAVKVVVR